MRLLPSELREQLPKFKLWLIARGAEVLEPVNSQELLKFRTGKGLSFIYIRDEKSVCSFSGEAEKAWREFRLKASKWRAIPATMRLAQRQTKEECDHIRARDGDDCFLCGTYVPESDQSIEHLVSLSHGGPQHLSNKYLAHKICNGLAGHKSAVEKIKIHDAALKKIWERRNVHNRIQGDEESN